MRQTGMICKRIVAFVCFSLLLLASGTAFANETLVVQLTGVDARALSYIRENIVPSFEAKYGITVELENVDWANRLDRLVVRTAGGVPPDVFMSGAEHILELVQNNLIAPIDEELAAWEEADDFFPATWGSSTFRGVHYGVPYYTAPRIWWYRISLFEEAGLDATQPPSTWDELLNAVRRLSRYDGETLVQFGYSLQRINPGDQWSAIQDWVVYLWQAGGELVSEETLEPLFDSPAGREALRFVVDLRDAVVGPATELPFDDWGNLAFSRRASAIYLAGPWVPSEFHGPLRSEMDDVAAFWQVAGAGGPASVVFTDWLGIHPASKNKELAWRFIQELTSAQALVDMHMHNGTLSPRRSTVSDYVAELPLTRYMYMSMDVMRPYPVYPNPDKVMKEWHDQYVKVMRGEISVEEGLAEAARLWAALSQ